MFRFLQVKQLTRDMPHILDAVRGSTVVEVQVQLTTFHFISSYLYMLYIPVHRIVISRCLCQVLINANFQYVTAIVVILMQLQNRRILKNKV